MAYDTLTTVIASHPVGAKRRRMIGSAKQSRTAYDALDCFVALLLAMTESTTASSGNVVRNDNAINRRK
jgi:hypothetical protein